MQPSVVFRASMVALASLAGAFFAEADILVSNFSSSQLTRHDPVTGAVTAVIDASGLPVRRPADPEGVLNGIAALPDGQRFLVTGKLWPAVFEVSFVP